MTFYLILLHRQKKSVAVFVLTDNFDEPVEMLSVCKHLELQFV